MNLMTPSAVAWLQRLMHQMIEADAEGEADGSGAAARRPLEKLRAHVCEEDWFAAVNLLLELEWGPRKVATRYVADHLPPGALVTLPAQVNRRAWWGLVLERLAKADDPALGQLVHRCTGARLCSRGGRVGVYLVDPASRRWQYCRLVDFGHGPILSRRVVLDVHEHAHLPLAGVSVLPMRPALYNADGRWEAVEVVWG